MTLKLKTELRNHGLQNSLRWKFNVFQLAKRVRRATRNGQAFTKVIEATKNKRDRISDNRNLLARVGLRRREQTLRVAKYYCAAFCIPMREQSFSL